eukprot:2851148-Rhodomonas_salina.1
MRQTRQTPAPHAPGRCRASRYRRWQPRRRNARYSRCVCGGVRVAHKGGSSSGIACRRRLGE